MSTLIDPNTEVAKPDQPAAPAIVSADDQRKYLVDKGGKAEELAALDEAGLKTAYETAKAGEQKPAAKDTVPDKYEFKAPAGVELDADSVTDLSATAKELGLSQDKANKVFEIGAKFAAKRDAQLRAGIEKANNEWIESSKNDKEFGGAQFGANLALAKLGMKGEEPALLKMLNETGLGNHPEMIRHFFRIGKTRKPSDTVLGAASAGQADGTFNYEKSNLK